MNVVPDPVCPSVDESHVIAGVPVAFVTVAVQVPVAPTVSAEEPVTVIFGPLLGGGGGGGGGVPPEITSDAVAEADPIETLTVYVLAVE